MIFTDLSSSSSSFENTNLTNHGSNELEIMCIHRFSSDLVHRHIIFLYILKNDDYHSGQYDAGHTYVKTGKPCEQ